MGSPERVMLILHLTVRLLSQFECLRRLLLRTSSEKDPFTNRFDVHFVTPATS